MDKSILKHIQELLTFLPSNVRTCQQSFKGIKAFQHNAEGLVFSTKQLHCAAGKLLCHAQQLSAKADDLYGTLNPIAPEE